MGKNLLLLGGGGHCKSVLDSVLQLKSYAQIAVIGQKEEIGSTIFGTPVIGSDRDLERLFDEGYTHAFICIGNGQKRGELYSVAEDIGFEIPNIIDPTAVVSRRAELSGGIFIGKSAAVNAGAEIQSGVIINTSSVVEHDCHLGEFSHIAPGSVLCGEVQVGSYTLIGANSVVKQQVEVGSNSLIGVGSVVVKNVADRAIAYGNPCEEVKKI